MSVPVYDQRRDVYVCRVLKAAKDNKKVKKGESYIWVQRTKFSPKEYFRDEKELEKKYPSYYRLNKKQLATLIKKYPSTIKIEDYLNKVLK